jgi:hypothetical protein
MAATATPWSINSHRIAFLETCDAFSKLYHPSGVFMSEREWRREA